MIFVGIDPGLKGAVAVLDNNSNMLLLEDMPTLMKQAGRNKVNTKGVINIFDAIIKACEKYPLPDNNIYCTMEKVAAMPMQGVSSMFSFGHTCGVLEAVALTYGQLGFVASTTWKASYKITKKHKDYARTVALEIFPHANLHLKKHVDRAEALLIAEWGRRYYSSIFKS